MGGDHQEMSPEKICYSCGDEPGGLDPEEQKERGRSTDSLPASLAGVVCWLAGSVPARGAGLNKATGGKGRIGREGLWDPQ